MDLKVTVVIPTHNGSRRIGIPLGSLLLQDAQADTFEIVVVDNASTDDTGRVVKNHPAISTLRKRGVECRLVFEECLGLTFGRIRGALEARSPLICFLDDDTSPEPNYISEGLKAFSDSATGLLVSRIYPAYETSPPPSIEKREHLLAINNKLGDSVIEWEPAPTLVPTIGAGMWVRRELFLTQTAGNNHARLSTDRQGNSLVSGGDIEIGILVGKAGYKRVYWPRLKLKHHIPDARLRLGYFCKLITGIVRSQMTLESRFTNKVFGLNYKALAVARLTLAVAASPVLLMRRDGLRETVFVFMSRLAQVKGPYRY